MATWTYATLTSALVATAELTGDTDYSGQLENIIDRAERRLTRDLDNFGLVRDFYTTLSIATAFLPKPTGALVVKSLAVQNGGRRTNLIMKTNEWLMEYWQDRTSVGTPKYYANYDQDTLILAPAPASANVVEMQFVVRPSALSAAETSNFYTTFCANALFDAAMVETAAWMKAPQMMQMWMARYQEEVALLRNEARRTRRDDMRPANVEGVGENNLQEGQP